MGNNTVTLVGVKKFKSKKGKDYAILQTTTPFNQREEYAGCVGLKIEEIFVPDQLLEKVSTLKIGKPVHFDYEISGTRAYVADFYSSDAK